MTKTTKQPDKRKYVKSGKYSVKKAAHKCDDAETINLAEELDRFKYYVSSYQTRIEDTIKALRIDMGKKADLENMLQILTGMMLAFCIAIIVVVVHYGW